MYSIFFDKKRGRVKALIHRHLKLLQGLGFGIQTIFF